MVYHRLGENKPAVNVPVQPVLIEQFGWSRAALSLASSITGVSASLCALLVGFLSERWSIKNIMLAACVLAAAGFFLCGSATQIWQIYVAFGVLVGLGANALRIFPNTMVVSNWFSRRRGTATGSYMGAVSGHSQGGRVHRALRARRSPPAPIGIQDGNLRLEKVQWYSKRRIGPWTRNSARTSRRS